MNHLMPIAITLFSICTLLPDYRISADEPPMPTITVSGKAEIQVIPDHAILTFSIQSRGKELDPTVADNDSKIKAVVEFLRKSGVEPKYIKTERITIRPIFEQKVKGKLQMAQMAQLAEQVINASPMPNKPRGDEDAELEPKGYNVSRQLQINIKQLAEFELIYRGLIKRGVNVVDNVRFRTSDLRTHQDTARLKAIRAAREKAEALANELGSTLAAVQTINENVGGGYRYAFNNFVEVATDDASEFSAGMIEVTASVQVVFKLGNTDL